jgi:hypothetical protein
MRECTFGVSSSLSEAYIGSLQGPTLCFKPPSGELTTRRTLLLILNPRPDLKFRSKGRLDLEHLLPSISWTPPKKHRTLPNVCYRGLSDA